MNFRRIGCSTLIALFATLLPSFNIPELRVFVAQPAQAQDNLKAEADRLFSQGVEQYNRSQFQAALQSWQQALELYRQIGNRLGEANSLNNLGNVYRALGRYEQAIIFLQQSLSIAREIDDSLGKADILRNLGILYNALDKYGQAFDYHQQSLSIAREIGDKQGEANSLSNLGDVYRTLGQYELAIDSLQQSLSIAREIGDRQGEANSLSNLGDVYRTLGQYELAIDSLQQSLSIAREIGNRQGEANSLGNLGNVYDSLGEYQQAIDYHQQSLSIAREIGDRLGEANSLGNLGNVYSDLGQYELAIDSAQNSLSTAQSLRSFSSSEIAALMISLGEVYERLGNFDQADAYLSLALRIAYEIKDPSSRAISLNDVGVALHHLGQHYEAQGPLFDAIEVNEALREGLNDTQQVSFFETQQSPYRTLQQVLISLNQPHAALEVAERGRAQALLQLLCQRTASTDTACTDIAPITLEQMQQVAQQQQATLVEYSLIPEQQPLLFIWVIAPSGQVTFTSTPLSTLDTSLHIAAGSPSDDIDRGEQEVALAQFVRGTLTSLGATGRETAPVPLSPTEQAQRLQQLYQQLIAPIASLLPQDPDAPVIFIPQGALFQVPFAALQDEQGTALIEQHTILTAPSIQVLAQIGQASTPTAPLDASNVLVVGNPATVPVELKPGTDAQELPELLGAEQEAIQIAELLDTQALLGEDATEAAVVQRMQQSRLIHLATHGLLDFIDGSGTPGAIALAPDPRAADDGLLSSEEILALELDAELVVLSACDTGGGAITGDGVIGLSRALISAGTPNVLVSLWKVPDEATAQLMSEFYQQWRAHPEAGKAAALRVAMLRIRATSPDPLSWAAFTLIGAVE